MQTTREKKTPESKGKNSFIICFSLSPSPFLSLSPSLSLSIGENEEGMLFLSPPERQLRREINLLMR